MANKIGAKGLGEDEAAILNKLDETPANGRLAEIDDYNSESAKVLARSEVFLCLCSFLFHFFHNKLVKTFTNEILH
jgi:hypothetical protein